MEATEDKFKEIRPFTDTEFLQVKKRLIQNDLLISTVRLMAWRKAPEFLHGSIEKLIRFYLKTLLFNIKSIDAFQKEIIGKRLLKWVLSHSTDNLTCSGLENLEKDRSYIFISNHRDIVLDSAIVDYLLHNNGFSVPYIAFGDNLLVSEMVEDLIRINKAFIVKRNLAPKQQLKALKHLSEYINIILKEGNHIWIAQREGRAKDGIDQTNPAIIKMFHLAERKNQPDFSSFINSLGVVPVSISYEKDPCDRLKARELHFIEKKGSYEKKSKDDLVSMAAGISGDKGNIHVAFGKPLQGELNNEKAVADAIDEAIQKDYHLWPRNYIAFDSLNEGEIYASEYTPKEKKRFLERYRNLKPDIQRILLQIYANPVVSKRSFD